MTAPATPARIMVMGPPGSGKSTLARRLGANLGLPVTHLDQLFHGPGWRPRPDDAFRADAALAASADRWVIDGNYVKAIGPRLAAANLIFFLDLPRRATIPRLLRRIANGWGTVRADSAPGCPERLDLGFLLYAWRWPRAVRPRTLAAIGGDARLVRLTNAREVEALVARLIPPARASAP